MIQDFIHKIPKYQKILISYSGGLDSTVLLHQLIPFKKKTPFIKLRAIHINHQINIKSNLWSQHCKTICIENEIDLIIKKLNINIKNNIQEYARKLRYQIIEKNMLPDEILVTGHHCNDQCETLFLSLKRGSGISGLCGIAKIKQFGQNKTVIRPLLKYSKNQLKLWALKKHITWIEDDSNQNNKYDRNFIRNNIIHPIQKKWPYFIKNCTRSMKLCYQQLISINYFLDHTIKNISLLKDSLNITKLFTYPIEIQILLIRRWIFLNINHNISYNITKKIYNNVQDNTKKFIHRINIHNIDIRKYQDKIFYIPKYHNVKNHIVFWLNTKKPLKLPDNIGYIIQDKYGILLPKPKKYDLINIRFQLSKNIKIDKYNKKQKNIWQKNHITPWNRNRIPSLFYNNKLIAIMGILNIKHPKQDHKTWKLSWVNYIM